MFSSRILNDVPQSKVDEDSDHGQKLRLDSIKQQSNPRRTETELRHCVGWAYGWRASTISREEVILTNGVLWVDRCLLIRGQHRVY
jgi:hypothetical protein